MDQTLIQYLLCCSNSNSCTQYIAFLFHETTMRAISVIILSITTTTYFLINSHLLLIILMLVAIWLVLYTFDNRLPQMGHIVTWLYLLIAFVIVNSIIIYFYASKCIFSQELLYTIILSYPLLCSLALRTIRVSLLMELTVVIVMLFIDFNSFLTINWRVTILLPALLLIVARTTSTNSQACFNTEQHLNFKIHGLTSLLERIGSAIAAYKIDGTVLALQYNNSKWEQEPLKGQGNTILDIIKSHKPKSKSKASIAEMLTNVIKAQDSQTKIFEAEAECNLIKYSFIASFTSFYLQDSKYILIQYYDFTRVLNKTIKKHSNQIICSITHELLTPINAIQSVTTSLKEKEQDNEQINMLYSSAFLLHLKIRDFICCSEYISGNSTYNFSVFNIMQTIKEVGKAYKEELKHKEIALTINSHDQYSCVNSDSVKMQQLISIILSHVIKFMRYKGKIILTHTKDKGYFNISISAINIAQDSQSTESSSLLSGMALTVAKIICKSITGQALLIEYKESEVSFTFKIRENYDYLNDEIPDELYVTERYRKSSLHYCHEGFIFCITDDNYFNRLTLKTLLLKILPYARIIDATDGAEAVSKIKKIGNKKKIIVFMDYDMPIMDGAVATRLLIKWKLQCHASMYIIGVTAFDMETYLAKCIEAGMNETMVKPISMQTFNDCMNRAFQNLNYSF